MNTGRKNDVMLYTRKCSSSRILLLHVGMRPNPNPVSSGFDLEVRPDVFPDALLPRYTYFMPDSVLTASEAHYVPILRSGPSTPQHPQGIALPLSPGGMALGYVDIPASQLPDSSCSRQWTISLLLKASCH